MPSKSVVVAHPRVSRYQDGGHVRLGYSVQDFEMLAKENGVALHSLNWTSFFNDPKEVRMFYQRSSNIEYIIYFMLELSRRKSS